jgi:hypothetical protein
MGQHGKCLFFSCLWNPYNSSVRSYCWKSEPVEVNFANGVTDTLFKKRGSLGKERAAKLKELRENKLRDIYEAALKTPGSRELTVEEAEKFIRPYESASDALKADIEKSLRSSKP